MVIGALKNIFFKSMKTYFSQNGEDILLEKLLPGKKRKQGFYVEVGCNDPIDISNTFRFYLAGWRGLLIDANAKLIAKNKRIRKKDTVICAAISDQEHIVNFYESTNTSWESTLDVDAHAALNNYKMQYKPPIQVKTQTLDSIFKQYLPNNQQIDILSIDIEGHDYNALISFDIDQYRPYLIIIEIHGFDLYDPTKSEIYTYLTSRGYDFVGYAVWNAYFRRKADEAVSTS